MKRKLHLNLFIHSRGHHEASWRHPMASPLALTDIAYYQDLARKAEEGLFDSLFLADQLALADDVERAGRAWLEPIVGADAELLLAVLVLDETQREAGHRLGLSHEAARKRFQRALTRLREHLSTSLSHPSGAGRVCPPKRGSAARRSPPT